MVTTFGSFGWFLNRFCPDIHDRKEILYLEKFFNVYLSRFEYKGLPDEMVEAMADKNLFEYYVFFTGVCAWFKDPVLGLMALPVDGGWKLNGYGKPTEWYVHGINGNFVRNLNENNSVLMFNDMACTIPLMHLLYDIRYICSLDDVSRQNINAQFQPFVFYGEESEIKTMDVKKSLVQAFKDFVLMRRRRGKKNVDISEEKPFEVYNTETEFKVNNYQDALKEFENKILTYLGFKNVNIEKRERLLTGEVSANDMIIQANYTNALNQRKYVIEKVNEMFGSSISVEPTELETLVGGLTSLYQGGAIYEQKSSSVQGEDAVQGRT